MSFLEKYTSSFCSPFSFFLLVCSGLFEMCSYTYSKNNEIILERAKIFADNDKKENG